MNKNKFRIQIIGSDNGVGLSKDIELIIFLIETMGIPVVYRPLFKSMKKEMSYIKYKALKILRSPFFKYISPKKTTQTINIFLQNLDQYSISHGDINCFMPNPEWCKESDIKLLPKMNYVLCKTFFTQKVFYGLSMNTYYTGFTSEDRIDKTIMYKSETFFHLAGSSAQKGTNVLVELWLKHPEWPHLTVIQNPKRYTRKSPVIADNIDYILEYLDDKKLKKLQNENLFHLCPSEAEGFGHYIAEAMSCGAITLTTDAPPMNELIDITKGILVKYKSKEPQRLGMNYYVDEQDLEKQITKILKMGKEEKEYFKKRSRQWFLSNDRDFKIRFKQFITMLTES